MKNYLTQQICTAKIVHDVLDALLMIKFIFCKGYSNDPRSRDLPASCCFYFGCGGDYNQTIEQRLNVYFSPQRVLYGMGILALSGIPNHREMFFFSHIIKKDMLGSFLALTSLLSTHESNETGFQIITKSPYISVLCFH